MSKRERIDFYKELFSVGRRPVLSEKVINDEIGVSMKDSVLVGQDENYIIQKTIDDRFVVRVKDPVTKHQVNVEAYITELQNAVLDLYAMKSDDLLEVYKKQSTFQCFKLFMRKLFRL